MRMLDGRIFGRWSGGLARRGLLTFCLCGAAVLVAGASSADAAQIELQQGLGQTTTAQLSAQINPQGADTTCEVQYVIQPAFEREGGWAAASTVPCSPEDLGAGSAAVTAKVSLTGLAANAVYYYRFLATAGTSTVDGPREGFSTFGIETLTVASTGPSGRPYSVAGGRPYTLGTTFIANSDRSNGTERSVVPDAQLKDVRVELPPGLIGDPAATPRCPRRLEALQRCPSDTQIGTFQYALQAIASGERPLFNLVPPRGVAAQFGGVVNLGTSLYINARVRTGSDYGIEAASLNITPIAQVKAVVIHMWGEPAAESHNADRVCGDNDNEQGCAYEGHSKPFLREPTSCGGQLSALGAVDSYQEPGRFLFAGTGMPAVTGCKELPFAPSLEAKPTVTEADSPTGLTIDLHVPQHEEPEETATSDLKDATIAFPAGMALNPSSADGLASCSEEQVGFTGFTELDPEHEPGVETAQFTPGPAECPQASKLGMVQIETPLIEHPLPGGLYLATPHGNPFGSLVAVYLTVHDPVTGIVVKLPGLVALNKQTGQVTTTFDQNPQLPFEHLKVELFGDKKRASLTTPEACGSYATTSILAPWDGNPASTPASKAFQVTGVGGGACAATEAQAGNAPGFAAGTASPVAGTYSPFELKLTREDGSQHFGALNVTLPPGMTGKIAGVEECPETNIEEAQRLSREGGGATELAHPSCPAGSAVGVVHVGAGSGAPFFVNGTAYFAGPYKGAPFSIVFVTPAIAGPFDLGVVTVRAALYINPETAQVTVKSDPFPTILDGIPLDIRSVGVEMTRPEFTLNPTSCNVMSVTGQEISTAGQTAALSDRFQVGGCDTMPFDPSFAAITHARHTRQHGEYLHVVVQTHPGQANIAQVHVQLPSKLPSELPTLKLACTEAQFDANPAGCPADSVVGTAIAHTPILPVPLEGPAMFVSHGGKGFPNLDLVLQGDGVHITLVGDTFINGKQVTTSTFKTVPDVPVTRFDLVLPASEHPALGGNGNMCRKPLYMPTTLTGQNGSVVRQKTKVLVTGCKPELRVLNQKSHRSRARLRVRVPAAGELVVTGHGIGRVVKRVKKAKTVSVTVRLSRRYRRAAARRRLKVRVKVTLRFKPRQGKTLHTRMRLLLR